MIIIEFLGPIDRAPLEIEAETLAEVASYLQKDETLSDWLAKSAVALNDRIVSDLDIRLKSGDKVSILPPVCGG